MNLFEAKTDKPWSRDNISKIADMTQERFDALQSTMSVMGDLTDDAGKKYKVWGKRDAEEIRYYVGTLEDRCVGYILLRHITSDPKMFYVSMVFITPKFQRNGIGRKLYDFALSKGITLVSDNTLTLKSKAIWQSMMNDPKIEVTFFEYDHYDPVQGKEKPLTNLRQAFSMKSRRMVARLKTLREYREAGLGTFTHDDHRYNLNKLFKLTENIIVEDFTVDDLSWVLEYDTPDPERVDQADVTVPILVTRAIEDGEERLVVVDGLHRLARAIQDDLLTIQGKMVSEDILAKCDLTVLIKDIRKRLRKIHESYHDGNYDQEDNGEQNIEKDSRNIIAKVKWFARKLPIHVEMRPYMNRYGGGCQGVVLTDLYAKNPGDGVGTQVMSLMCQLADEGGITIYTDAEGPRSKAFYEKFGFEESRSSGHMLQRHPPLPDWFTEE